MTLFVLALYLLLVDVGLDELLVFVVDLLIKLVEGFLLLGELVVGLFLEQLQGGLELSDYLGL